MNIILNLCSIFKNKTNNYYDNPFSSDWRADKKFKNNNIKKYIKSLIIILIFILYFIKLYPLDNLRKFFSVLFCFVFSSRILYQLFFFWNRRIPLVELILEAGFIVPLSLYTLAIGTINSKLKLIDVFWILLFFLGTFLNFYPEYKRYQWKLSNKGLYTKSLFNYARQINYTGEILSFIGYAGLTGSYYNMWIPLLMGFGMIVWSSPELEWYLERKYKEEFKIWKNKVRYNFIPYVI